MSESDYLVIGAGISGLVCATELQRADRSVRVVDKGRGLGGRMATRRMGGARLDHGAQFFTVRDARFHAYVREWLDAGAVREWYRSPPSDRSDPGHPRYCGVTGMTDAPKHLARNLDVRHSEPILRLARGRGRWIAESETGQVFSAPELVLAAPLPQALQLLDTAGLDYAGDDLPDLRAIAYRRSLALLAILDGPSGLPAPGAIKPDRGPLTWIADNRMKGISPDSVCAVTIHTDSAFAERHWDSADAVRVPPLLAAAREWLHADVVECQCHRWAFSFPVTCWPGMHYRNPELQVTLAGDAFGGPKIERAALSGIEAAAQILA